MNYEDKLRLAKEALESGSYDEKTIKYIFPELVESEDERIRKEILDCFIAMKQQGCFPSKYKEQYDFWIAWLEKQGEKKPADKVEPKFKVGDWITNGIDTKKIIGIELKNEDYLFENGISDISLADNISHLWTIQDAKDGDVLANDTIVLIVDHLGIFENRPIIYSWYYANSNKFYGMGLSEPDRWEVEGFTPATKEQCDFLFKKMYEAGYEWNADTKKLKKIEQKPAWSEEDERMLNDIIMCGEHHCYLDAGNIAWLKSLKERVQHQLHWKPSEEQMEALSIAMCGVKDPLFSLYQDLKKLKG